MGGGRFILWLCSASHSASSVSHLFRPACYWSWWVYRDFHTFGCWPGIVNLFFACSPFSAPLLEPTTHKHPPLISFYSVLAHLSSYFLKYWYNLRILVLIYEDDYFYYISNSLCEGKNGYLLYVKKWTCSESFNYLKLAVFNTQAQRHESVLIVCHQDEWNCVTELVQTVMEDRILCVIHIAAEPKKKKRHPVQSPRIFICNTSGQHSFAGECCDGLCCMSSFV